MRTKTKVSFTIDEDIYAVIDKASKTLNLAKSQLAQEAFSLWLKKQTESLMAKGYDEMAEEDKAFADVTFEAQSQILTISQERLEKRFGRPSKDSMDDVDKAIKLSLAL